MNVFLRFLSYNNAVPIAISILLLGGVSAFAATDPQAIYNESKTLVSVDNTYLVQKDFSSYSPQAQIVAVTEDADAFYVTYKLNTIALVDGVWRDSEESRTLTIDKRQLAEGDLGTYASNQIQEVVQYEISRLRATQDIERKNVSQKVVATEYGGLIGKLLTTSTEIVPAYVPSVPQIDPSAQTGPVAGNSSTDGGSADSESTSGSLTLQVMGNNPARIAKGSAFVDLGVYVSDPPTGGIVDLRMYVNGTEVQSVQIDTSLPATYTIKYAATDSLGNSAEVVRILEIYDPNAAAIPVEQLATTSDKVVDPSL